MAKANPIPTITSLTLGMKLMRLSAVGSVEECMVVAIETQGTITRASVLTHRYGVVEVTTGTPIKGKNSWMPEKEWRRLIAREKRVAKAMDDAQNAIDEGDSDDKE